MPKKIQNVQNISTQRKMTLHVKSRLSTKVKACLTMMFGKVIKHKSTQSWKWREIIVKKVTPNLVRTEPIRES